MSSKNLACPKSQRLTRPSEFERVKRDGETQREKLLVLSVFTVATEGPFRVGFVTSRKIGKAVVRNRVRRRLRDIVRRHQHEIVDNIWIVTVARDAAARATSVELEDAWLRLAERASILAH